MTNEDRERSAAALISYQHQLEEIVEEIRTTDRAILLSEIIADELLAMAGELRKIADLTRSEIASGGCSNLGFSGRNEEDGQSLRRSGKGSALRWSRLHFQIL